MTRVRPALDPDTLTPRCDSSYPEPFRSLVLPREKRALGDALGLSNRDPQDSAEYPDVDLAYRKGEDGRPLFFHKDGTPYP